MTSVEDTLFPSSGTTSESESNSDSGRDVTDPSEPHTDMEYRDGREKDAVRQKEYRAQSNTHSSSRKGGHGAEPWKRMLWDHVDKALARLQSQHGENQKKRRKDAPFRVQLRNPKTKKTVSRYFWHGEDIVRFVCDCLIPVAKGKLDVRVQKRVSNKQEWHSGMNQPHLNARVNFNDPMFGLDKMVRTYNWDVWKTRLPELDEAKAMA